MYICKYTTRCHGSTWLPLPILHRLRVRVCATTEIGISNEGTQSIYSLCTSTCTYKHAHIYHKKSSKNILRYICITNCNNIYQHISTSSHINQNLLYTCPKVILHCPLWNSSSTIGSSISLGSTSESSFQHGQNWIWLNQLISNLIWKKLDELGFFMIFSFCMGQLQFTVESLCTHVF